MGEACPQVEKKQFTLDTAGCIQARTIEGVFMFRSAAQKVTETKSSLPTVQELPSHQEPVGNQVKTTKNPGGWSTFGKFKVSVKKTQKANSKSGTTGRRKNHKTKPRSTDPYKIRDQELKMEERKRALRRTLNWKTNNKRT